MFLSGSKIKKFGANFLLILTTFFWGVTFVVVKEAISRVDVFVFLAQRFLIAFLLLLLLWPLLRRPFSLYTFNRGVVLGTMLFGGFAFQTVALLYTSASNTAFLTGLNVVFVPLVSALAFGHRIKINILIGVMLAFAGLYLLCSGNSWSLNKGDLLGILCALCIAVHIIYTGRFARQCDIFWLTTIQIGTIGLLSTCIAFFTGNEVFVWFPEIKSALVICVLFATIFAFLVQTTMQQFINPSNTAIIFCMEPVFAAICAYILIGEQIGPRGAVGAVLIFMGMISSEVSIPGLLTRRINS